MARTTKKQDSNKTTPAGKAGRSVIKTSTTTASSTSTPVASLGTNSMTQAAARLMVDSDLEDMTPDDISTITGTPNTANSVTSTVDINEIMKKANKKPAPRTPSPSKKSLLSFSFATPTQDLKLPPSAILNSGNTSTTASTSSGPPKDKIYITTISGEPAFSGFAVYFLPDEKKTKKNGPWSTKLMMDLAKAGFKFGNQVTFEKRAFTLILPNGETPKYDGGNGRTFPGRIFPCIGVDPTSVSDDGFRELADVIVAAVTEKNGYSYTPGPVAMVPDNFLDRTPKIWSDVMGVQDAWLNFLYKYEPTKYSDSAYPPDDDTSTWGKLNPKPVKTYFREGMVTPKICYHLGLSKEWSTEFTTEEIGNESE
jgi:hypothetical protein